MGSSKTTALVSLWLAAGCGGRSAVGGGGQGTPEDMGPDTAPAVTVDCEAVSARIEEPPGQIGDAGVAQGVALAFAELQALATAPTCDALVPGSGVSGTTTCNCAGGGSLTVRGTSAGPETDLTFDYDDCCFADCCVDASGAFQSCRTDFACGSVNGSYTCAESSGTDGEFCVQSDGRAWFAVAYGGTQFAVSGAYLPGTGGEFAIRDVRTTWDCTEDAAGAGCCIPQDGGGVLTWGGGSC